MKLAVIDNENEVRKGIVLMLQHNFPEAEIEKRMVLQQV